MRATTTPSPRLAIVAGPHPASTSSFSSDVRAGLLAVPKKLSSKYFYDEVGSALFDAITVLPEYYLTRAETEILREWGWEIVRALGNPVDFVELGSGSAVKTRILIEEALRVQRTLHYSPIDISSEALRASAEALVASHPALSITAYAGDYFSILKSEQLHRNTHMLVMFMGSNVGNYEPAAARKLMKQIARVLRHGDGLLLGTDMKNDPQALQAAYDDAVGVTAAFNKNLLARINRELGGHFDLHDFSHVAHYDARDGAVHSYLQALRSHEVRVDAIDLAASFEEGERIHTESSYKYSLEDVRELGKSAGLRLERTWMDAQRRFSVNLFVRDTL